MPIDRIAHDVELEQRRRNGRRHRHHAAELVAGKNKAEQRHGQDADQDSAAYPQPVERHDQEEANDGQHRRRLVQVAQPDQRGRVGHHDTGALERYEAKKQADAHGDRGAHRRRYAVDDHLAQAEDADQDEQAAGNEDRAQCRFPGYLHAEHHCEGKVRVQAHAGRERHWVVGVKAHDGSADGCGQAGGDEDGVLRHARFAEDGRVDEDDVGHGQERGQAREQLGAHVGAVFLQLEIPIEK